MMAWLTWRIGAFIIAGLLAFVAGAGLYDGITNRATISALKSERDIARDDLATANKNLGTCQANFRAIELALDRQGADIRDLASKSATATAEAQRRLAEIAKQTTAAREASQRVLALPRPAPDQACEAAAKLLRGPM